MVDPQVQWNKQYHAITYPETPQEVTESKKHSKSGGSKDDF